MIKHRFDDGILNLYNQYEYKCIRCGSKMILADDISYIDGLILFIGNGWLTEDCDIALVENLIQI